MAFSSRNRALRARFVRLGLALCLRTVHQELLERYDAFGFIFNSGVMVQAVAACLRANLRGSISTNSNIGLQTISTTIGT